MLCFFAPFDQDLDGRNIFYFMTHLGPKQNENFTKICGNFDKNITYLY